MYIDFEDTPDKNSEEQSQLFQALLEKAIETKEHSSFEYIKNITEFFVIRRSRKGLRKVILLFDQIHKELYKTYCKQIIDGVYDFNLLFVCTQYQECKHFYEEELYIIEDMLEEYDAYLGKGHVLDQWLFFRDREHYELWDHRKEDKYGIL